jgi:hypothetical protein
VSDSRLPMLVLNCLFLVDRIWTSVVPGANLAEWVTKNTENVGIAWAYLSLKFTPLNCGVNVCLL